MVQTELKQCEPVVVYSTANGFAVEPARPGWVGDLASDKSYERKEFNDNDALLKFLKVHFVRPDKPATYRAKS